MDSFPAAMAVLSVAILGFTVVMGMIGKFYSVK